MGNTLLWESRLKILIVSIPKINKTPHNPTKIEIIDFIKDFKIDKKINYILKSQSINNWINNTCNSNSEKTKIINRHYETSDKYKKWLIIL